MAEVSESEHKPVAQSSVINDVIQGMRHTKLIREDDDIISRFHVRLPQGYPIPSLERDSIIDAVLPYLENKDIYSRGRFGAWKYEVSNQDHSFMQGVEIAQHLIKGHSERTLHFPSEVNKQHNPFPYPEWETKP
jgi:hypothetical protein